MQPLQQSTNFARPNGTLTKPSTVHKLRCGTEALLYNCDPSEALKASRVNAAGELVVEFIVSNFVVTSAQLFEKNRGKLDICLARQIAMYLLHTSFSVNYHDTAHFFGRDRTTVSHACRIIEDKRDEKSFDEKIVQLEKILGMIVRFSNLYVGDSIDE